MRALVTRSGGGPSTRLATRARSTNQRYLRPTSAHSLESIGHPDRCGYQALFGPVRTALHGVVARFRGLGSRSERAFCSRRVEGLEPRLTPLSPPGGQTPARLRARLCSPNSQDRFASQRVNASELPRSGVPSPFLVADCLQSVVLSGDPRADADRSASRGRCNTTRDQVALANFLCPRTR